MQMQAAERRFARIVSHPVTVIILLAGIGIILSVISIGIGAVPISPAETLRALFGQGAERAAFIIHEYRLPRILLAWLVGSGLAVSGGVIQGVIRNPLAAPDVVGVTGGAGLVAATLLMLYPKVPSLAVPVAAFIGGLSAAALVYILAYRRGAQPARLALVGVAVSAVCASGIKFLMTRYPAQVNTALGWLSGTLYGRDWSHIQQVLPWLFVLIPVCLLLARQLDVLALGDDVATSLGDRVERNRLVLLLCGVALASVSVAVSGTIGFVGLIAPHMARRLVGPKHGLLLPASGLVGAILVLVADSIGRGARPPVEIPAGLITALIGAPYFLYLLARQRARSS